MNRLIPVIFLTFAPVGLGAGDSLSLLEPLLSKYCVDCHDSNDTKGEIDLELLLHDSPEQLTGNGVLLERLRHVIDEGDMPPPRPIPSMMPMAEP